MFRYICPASKINKIEGIDGDWKNRIGSIRLEEWIGRIRLEE
jgi:hypothetical protein